MSNELILTEKILSFSNKDISSFHALPISKAYYKDYKNNKYIDELHNLVGEDYLKNEITYNWIDNPVFPRGILQESENQTAKAFNVDQSLYVTTGTTTSNQIAIFSLLRDGGHVLVDRTCHQSVHFALSLMNIEIEYMPLCKDKNELNRPFTDLNSAKEMYKKSYDKGNPFDMVIINASSYEGVVYKNNEFINDCLKIYSNTTFMVDEAWIAFALFSKSTKNLTILNNIQSIHKNYPNANFVVTQSAHKSIRSLRQGSYIHLVGNEHFLKAVCDGKYQYDTTSPSFPILASLEIARQDMVENGEKCISKSIKLANMLKECLHSLKNFSYLQKLNSDVYLDPLKVIVKFDNNAITIDEIRKKLKENEIYISRYGENYFLVNMHIGVCERDVKKLIDLLKNIDSSLMQKSDEHISDKYVIPYPPGVPIVMPGDKITRDVQNQIQLCKNSHINLITVKG